MKTADIEAFGFSLFQILKLLSARLEGKGLTCALCEDGVIALMDGKYPEPIMMFKSGDRETVALNVFNKAIAFTGIYKDSCAQSEMRYTDPAKQNPVNVTFVNYT